MFCALLLENEKMEIFSMGGRSKSKRKFDGMKICEAGEVTEYFINPEIEFGFQKSFMLH